MEKILNLLGEESVETTVEVDAKNQLIVDKLSGDDVEFLFDDEEVFLDFISEVTENDSWENFTIGDLNIHTLIGGGLFSSLELEDKNLVFTDEVTEDILLQVTDETMVSDATMLAVEDTSTGLSYLIAPSAMSSLTERYGLTCRTVALAQNMEVPKEKYKEFLDLAQSISDVQKTETKALRRGGKIRTFNSSKYTIATSKDLLKILNQKLEEKFETYGFEKASWNHETTEVVYIIPTLIEKFVNEYGDEYEEYMPTVSFKTGDLANSSIKLQARLVSQNYNLLVGDLLAIRHMGNDVLETFQNNTELMYEKFNDHVKAIDALKHVVIDDMAKSFDFLRDKLSFPKTDNIVESVKTELMTNYGHYSGTAYVLLQYLQKIIENARNTYNTQTIIKFEENLARQIKSNEWN